MRFHTLALALLSLTACSSARPKAEAPEPGLRFTYHAALAEVPAGAAEVRLGVGVPARGGTLRALSVYGLVGNAPFELVLPDTDAGVVEREHVRVSWERSVGEDRAVVQEIVLATRGKPLELGLRLALATRAGTDVAALAAELAAKTWTEIDARPGPPPATHCEPAR